MLLLITLAFVGALGAVTAVDISHHGVTVVSVFALIILVLFTIGIVGALLERPRE
ncbi:MAG: hypothetical protein LC685_00315 [Actinobacteria bacterium]|nr:hypothetical protein [Actinomycetota bacterium]